MIHENRSACEATAEMLPGSFPGSDFLSHPSVFVQSGEANRLAGRSELAADGCADAGEGTLQLAKPPERPVT